MKNKITSDNIVEVVQEIIGVEIRRSKKYPREFDINWKTIPVIKIGTTIIYVHINVISFILYANEYRILIFSHKKG
ncbi:hypothetical protein, partial [Mycoplasma sp. 1232]|uniref:hypothetical protein n=1 Tax=Mycoplasma sp. 1232 TaxID=3108527 RepID=UPI002B261544